MLGLFFSFPDEMDAGREERKEISLIWLLILAGAFLGVNEAIVTHRQEISFGTAGPLYSVSRSLFKTRVSCV